MYGSFQPTLAAGKAELVRGAEELHVIGRAERKSCEQRLGVILRTQKQDRRLFLYILFQACKACTKGLIRVHETGTELYLFRYPKNSHVSSYMKSPD